MSQKKEELKVKNVIHLTYVQIMMCHKNISFLMETLL